MVFHLYPSISHPTPFRTVYYIYTTPNTLTWTMDGLLLKRMFMLWHILCTRNHLTTISYFINDFWFEMWGRNIICNLKLIAKYGKFFPPADPNPNIENCWKLFSILRRVMFFNCKINFIYMGGLDNILPLEQPIWKCGMWSTDNNN